MLRLSHAIRNGRYCRLGTKAQLGMDVIRVWAWMLWWDGFSGFRTRLGMGGIVVWVRKRN